MRLRTNRRVTILLATSVALLAGCESQPNEPERPDGVGADLFETSQPRAVNAFARAQVEAGARQDATLQAAHFDGAELNALGSSKLDLMAAGLEDRPMTIYMNFAEGDGMEGRRESVIAYLNSRGIEEGRLKFISGTNPAATTPAGGHLARIRRTESSGDAASAGAGAGDVPSGMGGSSSPMR